MRGRARAPGDAQKTTGKPEYSIPSGPSGAAAGREPSPKSGNRLSSGVLGSKRKRSFRHRGRSGRGARRAACGTHRTRHTVFGTSETAAWDMALYETSENSCYSDFGAQDLRSSPLRVRARHLDVTLRLGGRAAAVLALRPVCSSGCSKHRLLVTRFAHRDSNDARHAFRLVRAMHWRPARGCTHGRVKSRRCSAAAL